MDGFGIIRVYRVGNKVRGEEILDAAPRAVEEARAIVAALEAL